VGIANEEESFPLLSLGKGERREEEEEEEDGMDGRRRGERRRGRRGGSDKCGKGRLHKV